MTSESIIPGKYRHFKGKEYEVLGIARHSESLDEYVVYKALYDSEEYGKNALWIRPKNLFLGDVVVNGKTQKRFTPL
jgi:cyclomaltodextrinase / maltogenic alpha-amylase / neopullulanase